MPTIVACPSCGGKLRVADNLLGRKVRCPTCHSTFATAAPPLSAARGPTSTPAPESAAPPAPDWLNLSLDSEAVDSGPEGGSSASAGTGGLVGAVEVQTTPGGASSPLPQ